MCFPFYLWLTHQEVYKRKKPPSIRRFILIPIFLGTSTVYGSNHRGLNLSRLGWRLWN